MTIDDFCYVSNSISQKAKENARELTKLKELTFQVLDLVKAQIARQATQMTTIQGYNI